MPLDQDIDAPGHLTFAEDLLALINSFFFEERGEIIDLRLAQSIKNLDPVEKFVHHFASPPLNHGGSPWQKMGIFQSIYDGWKISSNRMKSRPLWPVCPLHAPRVPLIAD
jgi:hypothetical protein